MPSSRDLNLRELFDGLHDEAVILDDSGVILEVNRAWREFCRDNGGDAQTHYAGTNYLSICSQARGPSSAEASIVASGVRAVIEGGKTFRAEYPCNSPDQARWFELIASSFKSGDRRLVCVTHRNITSRKLAQEAAESAYIEAETLSALVDTSHDAILSYDLDCNIATWNPGAERLYGYSREEIIGQPLNALYPADWPIAATTYRDQILAGTLASFEATRIGKDGAEHMVWITGAPIRNTKGEVVLVSNIHRDVTELRKAEKAREIVAREVLHRFKNLLSVITAIQRQTLRNARSLEDFGAVFGERLASLSRSADLLLADGWTAADLGELVAAQLDPFSDGKQASLHIAGPPVRLEASAVQVAGMALHELATNAAKYGALCTPRGRIEITWDVLRGADGPELLLSWVETGLAQNPETSVGKSGGGFGRIVLVTLPGSMLNAESSLEMSADRVVWSIRFPGKSFQPAP